MSSSSQVPEKVTLTDWLRVRTIFIIDPVVSVLARWHVSPDLLTIAGMLLHFLVAWLVGTGELFWGGVAVGLTIPLDALDGSLARKLERTALEGKFGAFLDSTSDRTAEIILFAGFLTYFWRQDEWWLVLVSYIALTGSILVSYSRARAEALDISCKVGIFTRVERYVVIITTLVLSSIWPGLVTVGVWILAIGTWITVGQRAHLVWKQTRNTE